MKKFNLMNSKGISVLFLVIAMLLMITIGYVFSYLMPSKQKSVIFPIQSTQSLFIAQSGVEFAVRYATDNNWKAYALLDANLNGVTRNLGSGTFRLTYNFATYGDTLISVGEVPSGTERRRISLSNFSSFVKPLVLWTPDPCLDYTRQRIGGVWNYRYEVTFYIRNVTPSTSITLNSFRATWDVDPPTINRVRFVNTNRYTNGYSNGASRTYFNTGPWPPPYTYTFAPGATLRVRIRWNWTPTANCDFSNLIVYFYDTNGNEHSFRLDPEGDGLPSC